MPSRQITIQPYFQADSIEANNGMRLRAVITDVVGFSDTKLFRYLQRPWSAGDTESVLTFDGVCSPADLAEYRPDTPDPTRLPAFCRLDYVDLLFRSRAEALETWRVMQEELNTLLAALAAGDTLDAATTLVLGDDGGSSSTSESF